MTGNIIRLRRDPHEAVLTILPWYVTGQLDPAEFAQADAHLKACAQCSAELAFERQLHADVAAAPDEAEAGWALLRQQIDVGAAPRPRPRKPAPGIKIGFKSNQVGGSGWAGGSWLGWTLAAQLAVLLLILGLLPMPGGRTGAYHVLGSAPATAASAGNIVVVFRPDLREQELRLILRSVQARIVDGPTAADAYVLRVPANDRAAALARLSASAAVVLAEPIDAGATP